MMNKSAIRILLLIAIAILLNYMADKIHFRADFTADKRYTLSDGTREILKTLDDPVTITIYTSEGVNADFDNHSREVKNLLEEYRTASDGNIELIFINPNEEEETEKEAQQKGIAPLLVNSSEKDKLQQVKAYKGIFFESGDKSDVIPFLDPQTGIEYPITSTIKKIITIEKPKIAFLQGHGEAKLEEMQQAMQALAIDYLPEPYTMDESPIPSEYEALVILNPQDSFAPNQIAKIDAYYKNNGRLFIAYTNADINLGGNQQSPPMANERSSALVTWLNSVGITVAPNLLIDVQSQNIVVQTGFFPQQIRFFYFPVVTNFGEHPIVNGMEALALQFCSPVSYNGNASFTPLLKTTEKSGSEPLPIYFDLEKQWTESDFTESNLTLAGSLEDNNNKLVFISSGEFAINGSGQNAQQLQPDNINFLVNSLDWLSGDTRMLELRNKEVAIVPIKQLEESEKNFMRIGNLLLPILLIILYGFIRYKSIQNQRLRWQSENYIQIK